MAKSVAEQLRVLDEQRTKLLDGAKQEALTKAREAVDELNALGFSYVLSSSGRTGGGSRRGTRQVDPNKPCPICGFVTSPPHDGRAHRSQNGKKKPFTAEELSTMNMRKIP